MTSRGRRKGANGVRDLRAAEATHARWGVVCSCLLAAALLAATAWAPSSARAASAGAVPLEIVVARDGDISVATVLATGARGVSIVIPVPGAIGPDAVTLLGADAPAHLDAYTAPRLARYNDANPCAPPVDFQFRVAPPPPFRNGAAVASAPVARDATEARPGGDTGASTVRVVALENRDALARWLAAEARPLPPRARPRLERLATRGGSLVVLDIPATATDVRPPVPVRVRYTGRELWLPFRLGSAATDSDEGSNAAANELLLHVLTRTGLAAVGGRNNATAASGSSLPAFVLHDFERFYAASFRHASRESEPGTAWLEYAGDTGYCDPCVADPVPTAELHALGASWAEPARDGSAAAHASLAPEAHRGGARNVFVSRYRLTLGSERDDAPLVLDESNAQRGSQVRFVVRYPFAGPSDCPQGGTYRTKLAHREEEARKALAALTGWNDEEIAQLAASAAQREAAPR